MGKTFWDQARGSLFYLHDRTFYFSGGYFSRSYPNFSISKVHFLRSRFFINRTFSKSMNFFKIKDQSFNFLFLLFLFFAFVVAISIKNQEKIKINLAITITLFYLLSSPTFKQKKKSTQEKLKIVVTKKSKSTSLVQKLTTTPPTLYSITKNIYIYTHPTPE